jgi:nucleotide-binding universal stress UspA family protein
VKDQGRRILEGAKETAQAARGDLNTVLVQGLSAEETVERSETGNHDMIVMGSHGRTSAKTFFLGSVSDNISYHVKCAALIVGQAPIQEN